jgi:outer membrane protein assembly factor BamA
VSTLLASLATGAAAQGVPPPPPGFDAHRPLEVEDYLRKNERGYVTGLPLFNYDPNTGFGFGARGYFYWNGTRADPLFAYTPYLHRVFLQAFVTTGGFQFHWLDYDVPSIAGSSFRFRSQIIFERNTDEHYYGVGSRAMQPLSYSGSTMSYGSFSRYTADLEKVTPAGTTFSRYDSYDHAQPIALFSLERSLFRGLVRPLVGLGFTYHRLRDYTGRSVRAVAPDGQETEAPMAPTRLHDDCQRGLLTGCDGGWDNFLRLGLSFDTRDFEPDPNHGVFVDAALDVGSAVLGSRYGWVRFMFSPRIYVSPFPRTADLVIAVRGTLEVQSQDTPFFEMRLIPWTEDPRYGLGGLRTLRGYKQDRFVGPVMTLANAELRWTFVRFQVRKQKLALIAVPFLDLGAVHDRPGDVGLGGWKRAQGAALRISWNLATIITIDYGRSSEDSGLYINFNHMF